MFRPMQSKSAVQLAGGKAKVTLEPEFTGVSEDAVEDKVRVGGLCVVLKEEGGTLCGRPSEGPPPREMGCDRTSVRLTTKKATRKENLDIFGVFGFGGLRERGGFGEG